jgi:ferredoxin
VTITMEGCGAATATTEERVLVALERAQGFGQLKGLPRKLPVGCRRGGCGICRVRVLDGEYRATPMSRAHVSAAEEAAGVVLACAIYALTDLTLRLETPVLGKGKAPTATKS